MWIERIEIAGFGRLRGSWDLAEGLTVVVGPNEAGKSTLHDALVRAMFGYESSGRHGRRRHSKLGGESALTLRAPWGGDPFGLVAILHSGGRRLRAEWAFDRHASNQSLRLLDDETGEDLSAHVRGKGGDVALGEYLFGMGPDEYRRVCCIEQAAIGAVKRIDGLVAELRKASETGSDEGGVEAACERIKALRKSEVVGIGENGKPLKSGAYGQLLRRHEELQGLLDEAEGIQASLVEAAQELDRLRGLEEDLRRRSAALEQEVLLARQARLASHLVRAREAAERAAGVAPEEGAASHDPRKLNEARTALRIVAECEAKLAELDARARAAEGPLGLLQEQAAELDAEIRSLAAYEDLDASAESEVMGLLGRVEEQERQMTAAIRAAGEPASPEEPGAGGAASRWLLPGLIAAISVVAGVLVSPVALLGLLVAAAVYAYLARSAPPKADPAAEVARAQAIEAQARLSQLLDQLGTRLDGLRVAPGEAVDRARSYVAACKRRRRLSELRERRRELAERIDDASAPMSERKAAELDLQARREAASALLDELGISARGAEAEAELDRIERVERERRDRRARGEEAERALDSLLGGRTIEELEAEAREAEREAEASVARLGRLVGSPREEQVAREDLDRVRAQIAADADELGRLRERVESQEQRLENVPQWRAELGEAEAGIARLERVAEILRLADEGLREAAAEAHRRSVPGLNRAIAAELPNLTEGRYEQATVDEDLGIKLLVPETNMLVDAERLSRGTQDQIYLIERLAILELLSESATEPPPLLLDDAFAHFDRDRRRAALSLLAKKAVARQIVLFVDGPEVVDELEELGVDFAPLELPGPGDRVEA